MTTINDYIDQLLDEANETSQEARSYAYSFQHEAIECIFDSDSIETDRCDLDERTHRELIGDCIDFLFNEHWDVYEILRGHKISAEAAGKAFTTIRSGHGGFLVNQEITDNGRSFGDVGVY